MPDRDFGKIQYKEDTAIFLSANPHLISKMSCFIFHDNNFLHLWSTIQVTARWDSLDNHNKFDYKQVRERAIERLVFNRKIAVEAGSLNEKFHRPLLFACRRCAIIYTRARIKTQTQSLGVWQKMPTRLFHALVIRSAHFVHYILLQSVWKKNNPQRWKVYLRRIKLNFNSLPVRWWRF